jgi:purine-nucleoside phosphorylase
MPIILQEIDRIVGIIRSKINFQPRIGVILGTGLGGLADVVNGPVVISYPDLPGWPVSTVVGHAGRLVLGELDGQPLLIMQGRAHYYEGYSMSQVTLPIRVMQRLGIEILIVTNAAGAINPDFQPGDVMLITDHLNLSGMAGLNPLIGPNLDELGPRFPDMSGPSFESPADLRFLRIAGADAVGMSTVPEVIVARHGGTKVLGFSGISNKANLDGNTITSHEEVLEAGRILVPKLEMLIRGILALL